MGRHEEDDPFAPVRKPPEHVLGQLLDDLSIEELKLRIEALKTEIVRLGRGPARQGGQPGQRSRLFQAGVLNRPVGNR
jgi:uncharacterized small protein (DUF1192 family)